MMMYVWLLVGFVFLVKGADFFVEGCSSVAKLLRMPSVVIGLTIVALGTSAPEAAVSITAGLSGSNDIALGNVLGSNLFNLLMVVGVCACMKRLVPEPVIMKRDFLVSIAAAAALLLFMQNGTLSRWEGLVLLAGFVLYMAVTIVQALRERTAETEEIRTLSPLVSAICILGGAAAIAAGGRLVVNSASDIAAAFGLSQNLIALTIVAIGTSLPELVTSVVASRKGESGLALGNVVGSNILNILFILGMSSGLHAITVSGESMADAAILILTSLAVFAGCRIRGSAGRLGGAAMILLYLAYTGYIIRR